MTSTIIDIKLPKRIILIKLSKRSVLLIEKVKVMGDKIIAVPNTKLTILKLTIKETNINFN